jgi:hypothetical protein
VVAIWVIGTPAGRDGSAPEVAFRKKDSCLIGLDLLDLIPPFPSYFDGTFTSLNPCIHHQGLLIPEDLMEFLIDLPQLIVIDCSGG